MADSNKRFSGKYGTYALIDKIGSGGNGEVYNVDIENKTSDIPIAEEYVLKLLVLKPQMKSDEKERREKRFRREVEVVSTKLRNINGVIPILDSSYENEENTDSSHWYLMPKAQKFLPNDYSLEEKTEKMFQVAETICELHKINLSHRDIKPDNLLIYNNRLCLSDFGLLWTEDFDMQITGEREAIGPEAIRPPELEAPINQNSSMFLKSDVYLFAKTLWIVFTGIRKGFYKRYSRVDDSIYLKSLLKTEYTLEPIHELIEDSTYDDYMRRISIEECLRLLSTQCNVFKNRLPKELLGELRFKEAFIPAKQTARPDEVRLVNENEIYKFLSKMSMNSKIIVAEFEKEILLGKFKSINLIEHDIYEIVVDEIHEFTNAIGKKIYVLISTVCLEGEDKCTIYVDHIDNSNRFGKVCLQINQIQRMTGNICLDGKFELRIVP